MKKLLTSAGFAAMLLLCAASCHAQKTQTKYHLVYCDTIGHILKVKMSNYYPKKNQIIELNQSQYKVINVDFTGYDNGDNRTEVAIYVVSK